MRTVFLQNIKPLKLNKPSGLKNLLLIAAFLSCGNAIAELRIPEIFSDNMVVQQGKKIHVWGTAKPDQHVSVYFLNNGSVVASDAKTGNWDLWLPAFKAGQGGDMTIQAGEEKIVLKNVLVGEVWICSGQSNMEFPLSAFKNLYATEINSSANNNIRFATVKDVFSNVEEKNAPLRFSWASVNPSNVGDCSAVAYFFARKLYERLKIPVGLIISSWGGTPAQAWMDETGIRDFKDYAETYNKSIKTIDLSKLNELKQQFETEFRNNKSIAAATFKTFLTTQLNTSDWEDAVLPGAWENSGHPDFDGIAAYTISFTIPDALAGEAAVLHLPAIDDIDSTYINGKFIGSQTVWNELRTYKINPGYLKAGKNTLTIWVEDDQGGGGLNNDPDNYYLDIGGKKIYLKGPAKLKLLLPLNQPGGVNLSGMQNEPCVLFNAMIAPLLPLSIRGAIWYQGESNASKYEEYRTLFPAMITRWRNRFNQGDFPFLFVQLSSYNPAIAEPPLSNWAFLREAQTMALRLPNTGMAVTIDVGDQKDIHPKRKKEVGDRLASNAFKIVYGFKNEIASGPVYIGGGNKVQVMQLHFANTGGGLMIKGNELKGFSIAGEDKVFYPATGSIYTSTSVLISAKEVKHPVYVRYAWAEAPMDANLYNKEGFPAVPFRTDKD